MSPKNYYPYSPSLAAATIFTVLFGLTTLFHLYQMVRTRTWFFAAFTIGGLCKLNDLGTRPCGMTTIFEFSVDNSPNHTNVNAPYSVETIGFICRMINATETPPLWTKTVYIIQFLLILLAPAFFAASIYMGFGRIILLVDGEVHSLVKKKWLTKLFVFGDVLSFVVQAIGKALQLHFYFSG